MGLLDLLRRLLGGADDPLASPQRPRGPGYSLGREPQAGPHVKLEARPEAQHGARPEGKRHAREVPCLPPLHRQRKPGVKSNPARTKPYAFARAQPGGYSDARVGGSPTQLARFGLPGFSTPEELAKWLQVPLKKLAWLSGYFGGRAAGRPPQKLHHYHYVWVKKRSGNGYRLIEAPKPVLKAIQERILREILDRVPPHATAHGFTKGRSIVTNAAAHTGKYVIVKADLADFYPSVRQPRVVSIFRGMGYNLEVSRWLARLCTNQAPAELRPPKRADDGVPRMLFRRHLPQGAPTSPALANLSAYGLDVRLGGLARKAGIVYTRYADDLVFSGPEELLRKGRMPVLLAFVKTIIHSERFALNTRKLRIIRRGDRQQVTGLTVNAKPNVPRPYFDTLKAVLTNCARKGPAGQNRDGHENFRAHLLGQIAFVRSVNPAKAARLQRVFERIQWS